MSAPFGWCLAPPGCAPQHQNCARVLTGGPNGATYCGCEVRSCKCSRNPKSAEKTVKKSVQDVVDAL